MSIYNDYQLSSFIDQVFERLRAIEAQLAALSEKTGVPYEAPSRTVPPEVLELVERGDRMGAIKKYRELTACGMDEAKEMIAKL